MSDATVLCGHCTQRPVVSSQTPVIMTRQCYQALTAGQINVQRHSVDELT